ncbi:hypothetical protein F511_38865 [Dorcoceras hygrometricum]|uniref:Uncharacterized protein n=1 Tax=Dorcoceras hygrometricum TaxID=472368 RepID=A0A2Z7BTD7_9LAMI|nr:hypothetical protein F511_38865 [Dorcoceras hygrometricum]
MTFRVVRTNQYNQDLGLIHSTNGNHLESPNEGSSIDHQATIHLHAQNITMFPTNETWYFTSQMLVSSSGGLILILTSTRCVLGKLATLDLPMIVDLVGIFVLKGPYCTLTMTDWFLQALSVIPRGSWGDVARRFTMIRWESNIKWADSDSETTSSNSSSESEQEEVHCLMANQTISNSEFTREDLINALNKMVHEYKKLSQTFEEIKAENNCLKNSSAEPRTAQLGESDSLQTELSKLKIENDSLRAKSCELSSENERLNHVMSSLTKSSVSLSKLHETQKPLNDKSSLGFSFGESSSEETCTQSDLAGDRFKNMNFVKASVIHDVCELVKYDDQFTGQLNHKGKNGIGYTKLENYKPSWLTNRLEKDKAKSVPKSSVPNQQRCSFTKAKWVKVQTKRDLNGQSTKPKFNKSHKNLARTLVDIHTGKTVKVIQVLSGLVRLFIN